MNKKIKEVRAKYDKCSHTYDVFDFGVMQICSECGKSFFWEFDPYLYQKPDKNYIKRKLNIINEAILKLEGYKYEMNKYIES